jgi:hypothetical protein
VKDTVNFNGSVFMAVVKCMYSVCILKVILFYVSYVFLISWFEEVSSVRRRIIDIGFM